MSKTNWIDGQWQNGSGSIFNSTNPVTEESIWQGNESDQSDIDQAFHAARNSLADWAKHSLESRIDVCREYASKVEADKDRFADLISQETGKPLWEAKTEVGAVIGKIGLATDAINNRRSTSQIEMSGARAMLRYKPYGVMAVLGPFNLPAHLPNGHIVPAILAGNTVVFKPSEMTPAVCQLMIENGIKRLSQKE